MMNLILSVAMLLLASTSSVVQATPGFDIQLVFVGPISNQQRAAFDSAKARWEEVITGDIGARAVARAGSRICGQAPLAADLVIDDIVIFAQVRAIDGPGRVLGSAGPCAFSNGRVRAGSMQFDSADVENLLARGTFFSTVLHEMGHILGIGTRWENGLASRTPIPGTTSFNYLGANGIQGQRDIGGQGNPIVEGDGGPGTARGHWDEQTYQNELMTGFLSGNSQPMSRLTVQALKDIGYVVDVNKADAFTIPGGAPPPPPTRTPTKAPTSAPTNAGTKSPTNAPVAPNNGFEIQVVFTTPMSQSQQNAFTSAAARWAQGITGDIGTTVTLPAGSTLCGQPAQAANILIDDILIFAAIKPIDGAGRVLGQAGPCGFDQNDVIRVGNMEFDSADVAQLEASGSFVNTILHEMGHVLGVGTVWDGRRALVGRTPVAGTTSFSYLGANGIQGQRDIGGQGNPIVEGDGGGGTARGHWDEETYQNELMTGFLSGGAQPLSRLTVQALKDIGYVVDVTKADAFTIPSRGRRLRNMQDAPVTVWEEGFKGEITWDLFPMNKSLELNEDDWEIPFQGQIQDNLEEIPKAADIGPIIGGVVGAMAVVGAAAMVALRRRQHSIDAKAAHVSAASSISSSPNPMFGQQPQQAGFYGQQPPAYFGQQQQQQYQ